MARPSPTSTVDCQSIIRGSDDAAEAKASLMKSFKLTDEQATYILDMPLRRLTKMSKIELETEQKDWYGYSVLV